MPVFQCDKCKDSKVGPNAIIEKIPPHSGCGGRWKEIPDQTPARPEKLIKKGR